MLLWTYPENNAGSKSLLEKRSKDNKNVYSLNISSTEFTFSA